MLFFISLSYSVVFFFIIIQFLLNLNRTTFTILILVAIISFMVLQAKKFIQHRLDFKVISAADLHKSLYYKRVVLFSILNYNFFMLGLLCLEMIKSFSIIFKLSLFVIPFNDFGVQRGGKKTGFIESLGFKKLFFARDFSVSNKLTTVGLNFLNLRVLINIVVCLWLSIIFQNSK